MSEPTKLTPVEVYPKVERGEALPIDVRDERLFDNAHIAGARPLPLARIEAGERPPDAALILLYCA
jgi:rhodanese-related sulfurtransferase